MKKLFAILSQILLVAILISVFSNFTYRGNKKRITGIYRGVQSLEIKCEVLHNQTYTAPTISYVEGENLLLSKVELKGKWEGSSEPNATQAWSWFRDASGDNPFGSLDWTGITLDTSWTDNGDGTFKQKHEVKKVYNNGAWGAPPTTGWMAEDEVYIVEIQSVINNVVTTIETFVFDTAGTMDFGMAEYKMKYEGTKTSTAITSAKSETGLALNSASKTFILPTGIEYMRVNWKNSNGTFYSVDFPISIISINEVGLNVTITPEAYPSQGYFPAGDTIDVNIDFKNNGGTELKWNEGLTNGLEKLEFFFSGPKDDYQYIYEKVKVIDKYKIQNDPQTGTAFTNPIRLALPATLPGEGTYTLLVKAKRVFSGTTEIIELADIQVGSAKVSQLPVANCETCHKDEYVLSKHGANDYQQCLVCHVDEMGKAFSKIVHSIHNTSPYFSAQITNCSTCHINKSNDNFTPEAQQVCTGCHNPVPFMPADHTDVPLYSETGLSCATANCHSSGKLGVFKGIDETHGLLANKYTGGTLKATYSKNPPVVDGIVDNVWDNATSITTLAGAEIKAIYDTTNIYFLVIWEDGHNLKNSTVNPTENVDKNLWEYDTSWTKSGNEDRFAFMWEAGSPLGASCTKMCHSDGTHSTHSGNVDVWHWKAARTNPVGLADDKWWDNSGRSSDAKTSSCNFDNINANGDGPLYSGPITDNHFIIIPKGGTVNDLIQNISQSSTYPGYYLSENAEGSEWDVKAKGIYDENTGKWTLELKRALNTGHDDDVVFELNSSKKFSTAIFDNTGGGHASQGMDVGEYTLEIGGIVDMVKENELAENFLSQNYPNPAIDITYIDLYLKQSGNVSLDIYNMSGNCVLTVNNGTLDAGKYTFAIDTKNMETGTFLISVNNGKFRYTRRMIVL